MNGKLEVYIKKWESNGKMNWNQMVLINAFSTDDQKITKDYLEVKPQTKVEEVWLLLSRYEKVGFPWDKASKSVKW